MVCFVRFDFEMCFAPQRRATFHLSSDHMAVDPPLKRAYFSTLRSHKSSEKHSVLGLSYLFAHLDLLSSETFSFLILFLLLFSSLTLRISAFHLSILSEVWFLNFLHYAYRTCRLRKQLAFLITRCTEHVSLVSAVSNGQYVRVWQLVVFLVRAFEDQKHSLHEVCPTHLVSSLVGTLEILAHYTSCKKSCTPNPIQSSARYNLALECNWHDWHCPHWSFIILCWNAFQTLCGKNELIRNSHWSLETSMIIDV